MYLLDTDVLVNLIRPNPPTRLLATMVSVPAAQQFTSSVTLGELVYGAHRQPGRAAGLLERLERTLSANLVVLPFDEPAARRYGGLRADLERRGTPLDEPDLRIASIALARGLTLVTGNVRHFERVPGLSVENWLEE